jgi:hypothetical protein
MANDPAPNVNPTPAQPDSAEAKFFLRSKTVLSAILLALPQILGACGISFSDATAQQWLQILTSAFGFAGIVWGRVKSTGPLHFGGAAILKFLESALGVGCVAVALLLSGCTAAQKTAAKADLTAAAKVIGSDALPVVENLVIGELTGGASDFVPALSAGLKSLVTVGNVEGVLNAATGNAMPQTVAAIAPLVTTPSKATAIAAVVDAVQSLGTASATPAK